MSRRRVLRRRYGRTMGDDTQAALVRAWWAAAEAQAPVEYERYRDTIAYSGFHISRFTGERIRKAFVKLNKAMTKKGMPYPGDDR